MYEALLTDVDDYLQSREVNELISFELQALKKAIVNAEKNLTNEQVELVFVGPSGAGKTTVISSILGMYYIDEDSRLVQVMHSDEGGRTTPCTIEIIPSDKTALEIIPKQKEEIESIINEYCHFITKKGGSVPEEIRSIMKKWVSKADRDEFKKTKDIEKAKEEISKAINLDSILSDSLKIECTGDVKDEVFKEINTALNKVRKGNLQTFIIPDKIILYVKREYINVPREVSKIVDTRGISSETAKNTNSIVGRKDLDEYVRQENAIVIYINEFASVEKPVVEFYLDKLTSYRTEPEDLIKFMVLINTWNESIESKVEDKEEIEEFIEDKKFEFMNAVVLDENDEVFANESSRDRYKYIKDVIEKSEGEMANFVIYEPIKGLKKETENGNNYFIIEDEHIMNEVRAQFSKEVENTIAIRKIIIENKLKSDVQIARGYISNQIGLSNQTAIGNAVNGFKNNMETKSKEIKVKWIAQYFDELISLTKRMNGNTIAAYIRGNGRVISRNETFVDDIYYWHQQMLKELEEKLEIQLENEVTLCEERIKSFIDDTEGLNPRSMLQINTRQEVQQHIDFISQALIQELEYQFVGNSYFWDVVSNNYSSTYANALNQVMASTINLNKIISNISIQLTNQSILK